MGRFPRTQDATLIAALVSSYREGRPFRSTLASAVTGADWVMVDDAPIGDAPELGDETPRADIYPNVYVEPVRGRYPDDAAKRTHMLQRAKTIHNRRGDPDPLWILWLDGDELLLYGEYLADLAYRAEFETGGGGFPIRIVELDGSVAMCYGKVIRADAVRAYQHSSYQVELVNGMTVALPNVKICAAGGVPYLTPEAHAALATNQDEILALHRPPLIGEPHLLHRSILRSPERTVERQSDAESKWFSEILGPDGSVLKAVPR